MADKEEEGQKEAGPFSAERAQPSDDSGCLIGAQWLGQGPFCCLLGAETVLQCRYRRQATGSPTFLLGSGCFAGKVSSRHLCWVRPRRDLQSAHL